MSNEVKYRRNKGYRGSRALRWTGNTVALIWGLFWLFPVYWMVNSSLMTEEGIYSLVPQFIPRPFTLDNYISILSGDAFWSALRMSLAVACIVVVCALLFAFLAAVAISRFRFKGRNSLIVVVLIVQMIPAEALFISQYRMLDGWNLLNSVVGLSILYLGSSVPFTIWMLKGFVDGVPFELEEAAMIDGCSRAKAFMTVTLPLLASGLVASGIFAFLAAWNEYTLALITLTSDGSQTLPLWLQRFGSNLRDQDWGGVMAGSALMALPVVILFMFVQGRMAEGLVGGAVKG